MSDSYVKSRFWGFIIYPESLPDNWKDILNDSHLPITVSPLHDKDINADGEIKKSHYHVIIVFGNTTTASRANKLSSSLNGTIAVPVDIRGMYRYHCHLDNPEKAPYNDSDRMFFGGFNIEDYMQFTKSDLLKMKMDIIEYIEKEGIKEYRDLMYNLMGYDIILFEFASNHTLFFNSYICSRRNSLKLLVDKK